MVPIPVLDLFNGQVVHAVRGERAAYRPIRSILTNSSRPSEVLAGYLAVYPFRRCYIADLNALRDLGDSDHGIGEIIAQHRGIEFWIDAGFGSRAALPSYLQAANARGIIGTESVATLADYAHLRDELRNGLEPVLSLDFRGVEFLGPAGLLDSPALWPQRVMGINLERVGSGEGPDLTLLTRLRALAPQCALAAAGGVGDGADLVRLQAIPTAYVLLATALHNGRLDAAALLELTELGILEPR
jgi:phosphoribosylformimino-5-aminoimidazole carboxamide ribotide isomerase